MRTRRRQTHRERWIDPHDARLARQAGLRLIAADGELWLFDRNSGTGLGKWDRETGRLTIHGRRVADAATMADVVKVIDVRGRQ